MSCVKPLDKAYFLLCSTAKLLGVHYFWAAIDTGRGIRLELTRYYTNTTTLTIYGFSPTVAVFCGDGAHVVGLPRRTINRFLPRVGRSGEGRRPRWNRAD